MFGSYNRYDIMCESSYAGTNFKTWSSFVVKDKDIMIPSPLVRFHPQQSI